MNIYLPRSAALLLSALLVGCAQTPPAKPESVTAPGADIPAYSTFSWPAPGGGTTAKAPLSILDSNMHAAIRAQLIEKGYREVEENPDFVVNYEVVAFGAEKRKSPFSIGIGVGTWGSNVGGGVSTSVPVGGNGDESLQNRLTIRATEGTSSKELWVGTTPENIQLGDAAAVEKAVKSAMKSFPAKRS